MKTNVKSFLTKLAFAVLFVAMIGLALVNVNFSAKSPVSAAETPVFEISNGAYIKTVAGNFADKNAMRVKLTINQAFVEANEVTGFTAAVEMEGYDTAYEIDTTNWLDLIAEKGTETFNINVANFRQDQYAKDLTFYVEAITAEDTLAAENNGLVRSMEWTAAQAIAEGATGYGTYVGNVDAVGYKQEKLALETNKFAATNSIVDTTKATLDAGRVGNNAVIENTITFAGLSNVKTAYLNGQKIDLDVVGGVVTPDLSKVEYKVVNNLTILDGTDVYVASFKKVDIKVATLTDWMMVEDAVTYSLYTTDAATGNLVNSTYVYAALVNDINAAGTIFNTRMPSADATALGVTRNNGGYFSGEIDGQGYVVSNMKVNQIGMFWYIADGDIRNIGFTNVIGAISTGGGFLTYGTTYMPFYVENVYFQGSIKDATNNQAGHCNGLGWKLTGGRLTNVIVEVEFTNQAATIGSRYNIGSSGDNRPAYTNVYGISTTSSLQMGQESAGKQPWVNYGGYKTYEDLAKVIVETGNAEDFTSTGYWVVDNGIISFKQAGVRLAKEDYAKNRADAYAKDLGSMGVKTVSAVTVNGTALTNYTFADGILTIANDQLSNGVSLTAGSSAVASVSDSVIEIVTGDGVKYVATVNVADYAIGKAEEFMDLYKDTASRKQASSRLDKNYNVYFDANVVMGANDNTGNAGLFEGYIDGRGYSISDLKGTYNGYSVMFKGITSATIVDLGIINAVGDIVDGKSYGYLLCDSTWCKITITNCYFEFIYEGTSRAGVNNNATALLVNNSIINFKLKPTSTAPMFRTNAPKMVNSFGVINTGLYIPDGKEMVSGSTNYGFATTMQGLYDTLNAEGATINADVFENNSCWNVTKDNNTNKITGISWANIPSSN